MNPNPVRTPERVDVLVVGAGPTGLVLALWLKRLGASVRIVDRAAEVGTTSRALAVQARTLEFYRQMGIAGEVVERGLEFAAINLWVGGEHSARVAFADIGAGLSPFPFITIFPQDQHERLLVDHLRRRGVDVERRVALTGFEDRGDRVVAWLERESGGMEEVEASYVAGCDGAHSKVRAGLDVGFPGGTYERLFYVADVDLRGRVADHELHVALDAADLLALFPMKGEGRGRLIGTVGPEAAAGDVRNLAWSDVSKRAAAGLDGAVGRVHWFSSYRVHHRVAARFARGRVFLLGDAAHIHSPVGGQGMNTGIGDAVNLAWKLADVLDGRAHASLLDTYEPERSAFARRLVATTDRLFTIATKGGALARKVRLEAVPRIVPALLRQQAVRRWVFRTISQTTIAYRRSPWSEGQAGRVRGGDRLPWVVPDEPGGRDNFESLSALAWQVHVYGDPPSDLLASAARYGLRLHAFPWRDAAGRAGLARDASYLVRPDGYVALADPAASSATLERYLDPRLARRTAAR